MGECPAPIGIEEAIGLFAPLERYTHILAAVSGGPDSMALLYLLADWKARIGARAPSILVVTVDHGLRQESASEAVFVAEAASTLRLAHSTLRWEGDKPATGMPAAARAARYTLLQGLAAERFTPDARVAVVTAHTQDDQAETFLMRLQRGSGIEGLSGMMTERPLQAGSVISLVRPLLDVPKRRLVATLQARQAAWIEDPTNQNLDFERARVRVLLRRLEEEGLEAAPLARSARRLRAAQEALAYADNAFVQAVALSVDREIYAQWQAEPFRDAPPLLRERLLQHLIARFGGATPPPRLKEIEDLSAHLAEREEASATLGGAFIKQGPKAMQIWREVGRISPTPTVLDGNGGRHLWDGRFWVSQTPHRAPPGPSSPIEVRPLGLSALTDIKPRLPQAALPPAMAMAALPAFYMGHQLIGVPSLSYQCEEGPAVQATPAHAD